MNLLKRFIPYDVYTDIYKIDYNKLYSQGRRIIVFDLDNTIIPYDTDYPSEEALELFRKLKEIGFIFIVMSNNHFPRIKKASEALGCLGIASAKKPFNCGYKKIFKQYNGIDKSCFIAIGDQVITDIYGGRRAGIDVILVNAIARRTEKWYTRLNRKTEDFLIKKMKKKNYEIYQKIRNCRGETI